MTAWQETQDGQSVIGIGYQRFDSEGNALASELIRHEVPRPMKHNSSNISLEAGQGSNDFTVSLNSTGETFNVSSIGEKSQLYKTESGSYILDFAGSKVGDVPDSPVILINEKIVRGNVTQSLHSFKYEPTGTVSNENGDGSVYYQDARGNWFKDTFNERGVFKETKSLTFNELLVDETKHSVDLNNDTNIGDTVTSVLVDSGKLGLYKTVSNSLIIDNSGLDIGDSSVSPTLLVSQKVSGRNITTSLYEFKHGPLGIVSLDDGIKAIYYKNDSDKWFRDKFNEKGVFQNTEAYSLNQVLNDEITFNVDLNGDKKLGDNITEVLSQIYPNTNLKVNYEIANNDHFMFSIDPYSGQITLEGLLDTYVSSSYNLVVEAHLSDGRKLQ